MTLYRRRKELGILEEERFPDMSDAELTAMIVSLKAQRLTDETDDQRSARLAQLTHNQQQRLTDETDEQRRSRLNRLSTNHQQRRLSRLFDNPSDAVKIFHEDLNSLNLTVCSTCNELSFAELRHDANCARCSRDSSLIKLYSLDNNMDPGPLPPQLQVS